MTAADSPLLPSGIDAVDAHWGGLRPGSAVLLVGRAGAGRTALALRAIHSAVDAGTTALLLSPKSPDQLTAAASAAGFDLAAMHRSGHLRVLRIPSAKDLAAKGNPGMDAAYRDLAALAAKAEAGRVVIEDFTPLVQFSSFAAFERAFEGLRGALARTGASFLLGLGEPANDASRQLLTFVEERVDGAVRVRPDGEPELTAAGPLAEAEPETDEPETDEPRTDAPEAAPDAAAAIEEAPAPEAPQLEAVRPEAAEPLADAGAESDAPSEPAPEPAVPADEAEKPTEVEPRPVATEAPTQEETDAPEETADAPEPEAPEAAAGDTSDGTQGAAPADPFVARAPGVASNDGASLDVSAPPQSGFDLDAAPEAPGAPTSDAAPAVGADGIPKADVEPAPAPHPDLLSASTDRFQRDPGRAFFDAGYLIDSRGAAPAPDAGGPPAGFTPPATPPAEPAGLPSFASVGGAPADDHGAAAAKAALEAAFASRASGAHFLVVAARMELNQPESAYFQAVANGLRSAMPPGGSLYADASRLRSLMVVPGGTQESSTQVFAGLQRHLQGALGAQAEPTLRAVAAITVPDGQPFGTAQELWAYAVEG